MRMEALIPPHQNSRLHNYARPLQPGKESEIIAQFTQEDSNVFEGAAFKAVRQDDIPRLNAILFTGFDVNTSNDCDLDETRNAFCEIRDWNRMARVVRLRGYTLLHIAVVHSKIKMIKFLLSKGANINKPDANLMSPLSLAAAVQRSDVVQILINAGAVLNSQSVSGRTPLIQAVGNNDYTTVKLLLYHGADPNLTDAKGLTPLLTCLQARKDDENNINVLHALIDAGCDVDCPNKQGATALMFAVSLGRVDAVDLLLEAGANINLRDSSGQTVTHLASGSAMALYLIQQGATSDWPDNKGMTPLLKAARVGHLTLTNLFLAADSTRTNTILDVPRIKEVRKHVPLFDKWLEMEFETPRSLRRLCRESIRRQLAPNNTAFIKDLPIPQLLKDFLLCKHLHLVFKTDTTVSSTVPTLWRLL